MGGDLSESQIFINILLQRIRLLLQEFDSSLQLVKIEVLLFLIWFQIKI